MPVVVNSELQRERARVSGLELEQKTPVNVHRWRLLKGKDPGMHEMMQKLETYQEIIKKKNREIADKVYLLKLIFIKGVTFCTGFIKEGRNSFIFQIRETKLTKLILRSSFKKL